MSGMTSDTATTLQASPTPSDARLRRATLDDAQALSTLAARTFTETFGHLYPPQDLADFLADAYAVEKQRTILAWLLRDGPRTLWVGAWSENLGAQRFYARHGFEKVGDYIFPVGSINDLEFILRRPAQP